MKILVTCFMAMMLVSVQAFASETTGAESASEVIGAELKGDVLEVGVRDGDGAERKLIVDISKGSVVKAKGITLDKAISIARANHPGEVLEVEYERGFYEVKLRGENSVVTELCINSNDGSVSYDKR